MVDNHIESPINGTNNFRENKIRIIIADDHPLIRQALIMSMKKERDFEIIAEATNGEEVIQLTKKLNPDIIIMDISMPKMNGLEATRQLCQEFPNIAILILTIHNDSDTIVNVFQAGARGYLIKTATVEQIIQAIRSIIGGQIVWPLSTKGEIVGSPSLSQKISLSSTHRKLSPRELEILKLMSKGMSNKAIALKLGLQETSIKSYLVSLFTKMDVRTRTEAVAVGLQNGILTVEDFK